MCVAQRTLEVDDLPTADMIPRQYCPQCESPLASEALKTEKFVRGGQVIAHVRLACEHCGASYLARFGRFAGAWRFHKAEMEKTGKTAAPRA